jgi:hypothetical protein
VDSSLEQAGFERSVPLGATALILAAKRVVKLDQVNRKDRYLLEDCGRDAHY